MKIAFPLMKIAILLLICCNHAFPGNQLQSFDHVSRLAFPEENTCDFKCVLMKCFIRAAFSLSLYVVDLHVRFNPVILQCECI